MLLRDKTDLSYCNYLGNKCFYMVFRPTVFRESELYGKYILIIEEYTKTLYLTANVLIRDDIVTIKNVCYEHTDTLLKDIHDNDFINEDYYEEVIDIMSCMFGYDIVVENTVAYNNLDDNDIWKEMKEYIDKYQISTNQDWGMFKILE